MSQSDTIFRPFGTEKMKKKNLPRKFDQFSSKFSPEKINKNFQDFGVWIYLKSTVPCCILIYPKKKTDLVFFQNMKLEIFFSEIFWLPKILRNPTVQWNSINFRHFENFQKKNILKVNVYVIYGFLNWISTWIHKFGTPYGHINNDADAFSSVLSLK